MNRSRAVAATTSAALALVVGARFYRATRAHTSPAPVPRWPRTPRSGARFYWATRRAPQQLTVARFRRAPAEILYRARNFIRISYTFARHLFRIWKGGQIRFRLETFGLYYPTPPYQSAWWRVSPGTAWLLLRRLAAYARWVEEMETVQRRGRQAWWARFEGAQPGSRHV